MNESLIYQSRHNSWATKALLDACKTLSPDRLSTPTNAAYGSIIETFNHIVMADGSYLRSLGGPVAPWVAARDREQEEHPEPWGDEFHEKVVDLDELVPRIDETRRLWDSFFESAEFDAKHVSVLDAGTYECPSGIVMAQVFHHGSIHREQICAMLTAFGIEPPDIQPWGFADATGLSKFIGGRTS